MNDDRFKPKDRLNRRDFNLLSFAALGGVAAGSSLTAASLAAQDTKKGDKAGKQELHVCRGLNTCKGNGATVDVNGDGKPDTNACAGQGACATVKHTSCAGQNECKGLGGCGATAGNNSCKGRGACNIPLHQEAWKAARARFEARMKKENRKFGNPPPIDKTPQSKV